MSGPFDASAFVSTEVTVREVEMLDGKKAAITFRQLPHADWEVFRLQSAAEDEEVRARATSVLIAKSILDENGKPALTVERAAALKDKIAKRLVSAILEINGFGKLKAQTAESEKKS